MKYIYVTLAMLFSALSQSVVAHPHSFIDMQNEVLIEQKQLLGFKMRWVLDEIASSELIYEIKASSDKKQAEKIIVDDLAKTAVENHYFSYLYNDKNEPIKFSSKIADYRFEIKENRAIFYFAFHLAKPYSLANQTANLFTYEPTYYIGMEYNSEKDLQGANEQCQVALVEPKVNTSLKLYASKLDKGDTPDMPIEDGLSLGAQFAQKVAIKCQ